MLKPQWMMEFLDRATRETPLLQQEINYKHTTSSSTHLPASLQGHRLRQKAQHNTVGFYLTHATLALRPDRVPKSGDSRKGLGQVLKIPKEQLKALCNS